MDMDDFNFLYNILSATEHTFTLGVATNLNLIHKEHTNHVVFRRTSLFCGAQITSKWTLPIMQLCNLMDNAGRMESKRQNTVNISIHDSYRFLLGNSYFASVNLSQDIISIYKCHNNDLHTECGKLGIVFSSQEWCMFLAMIPYISKRLSHEVCNI